MIYDALKFPVYGTLVAVLLFNLSQRNHLEHGEGKRIASLIVAGVILLFAVGMLVVERYKLSPWYYIAVLAVSGAVAWVLRAGINVFRFHCVGCGRPLALKRTLYYDANLCDACSESHATLKASGERATQFPDGVPKEVDRIDWERWRPDETAVLCFLRRGDEVLLIRKKRGLGAGKINAPGGRIEAGESAAEAAIRETQEEIGVTPHDPEERVHLRFVFTNGYSLRGTAFFADAFVGSPRETDEAAPFWCRIDEIPFEKMWEDDREWLLQALKGERLDARFIFDGDRMISKSVVPLDRRDGDASRKGPT